MLCAWLHECMLVYVYTCVQKCGASVRLYERRRVYESILNMCVCCKDRHVCVCVRVVCTVEGECT